MNGWRHFLGAVPYPGTLVSLSLLSVPWGEPRYFVHVSAVFFSQHAHVQEQQNQVTMNQNLRNSKLTPTQLPLTGFLLSISHDDSKRRQSVMGLYASVAFYLYGLGFLNPSKSAISKSTLCTAESWFACSRATVFHARPGRLASLCSCSVS